jgi:hypothetical protein
MYISGWLKVDSCNIVSLAMFARTEAVRFLVAALGHLLVAGSGFALSGLTAYFVVKMVAEGTSLQKHVFCRKHNFRCSYRGTLFMFMFTICCMYVAHQFSLSLVVHL